MMLPQMGMGMMPGRRMFAQTSAEDDTTGEDLALREIFDADSN